MDALCQPLVPGRKTQRMQTWECVMWPCLQNAIDALNIAHKAVAFGDEVNVCAQYLARPYAGTSCFKESERQPKLQNHKKCCQV